MKLYKFGYNFWKSKFDVREVEVTEKDKCYVADSVRVLKSDVNTLSSYNSMYCLKNDPSIFIDALSKSIERKLEQSIKDVERYKEELEKLKELKKECKQ